MGAQLAGAYPIVVADVAADKLELARRLGATHTVDVSGQRWAIHRPPRRAPVAHRGSAKGAILATWPHGHMATVTATAIERSGPATRCVLAERAPAERERFENELRGALARAAKELDLADVDAVLTRWHALATMAANPLTDKEQAQVERAKAGDFTGCYARDGHGNWVQL